MGAAVVAVTVRVEEMELVRGQEFSEGVVGTYAAPQ
jgi:hypothetical protein